MTSQRPFELTIQTSCAVPVPVDTYKTVRVELTPEEASALARSERRRWWRVRYRFLVSIGVGSLPTILFMDFIHRNDWKGVHAVVASREFMLPLPMPVRIFLGLCLFVLLLAACAAGVLLPPVWAMLWTEQAEAEHAKVRAAIEQAHRQEAWEQAATIP